VSQGDDRALLKASVEADVPIQFAAEVWSEFIRRSLYGSYAKGFADVAASPSQTAGRSQTAAATRVLPRTLASYMA
jgi:hypothetical protein